MGAKREPQRRWHQISSWSNERFRKSHGDLLLLLQMVRQTVCGARARPMFGIDLLGRQ